MKPEEAQQNIGQPFTVIGMGLKFDTIRSVDSDGVIHGDWLQADAIDCRLKQETPPQFKKKQNELEHN